jgi:hypothetical protein
MELLVEVLRMVLPLAALVFACILDARSGRGYGRMLLVLVAIGIDVWATLTIQDIERIDARGGGGLGYDIIQALWFFIETLYTFLVGCVGLILAALAHQRGWVLFLLGGLALLVLFTILLLALPRSLMGGAPVRFAANGPYLLILCVPLAVCLAYGIRRIMRPHGQETALTIPTGPTGSNWAG